MSNRKRSSSKMASKASSILTDGSSSQIQKSLAASVLSQPGTSHQTGAEMESKASTVLKSDKYSDDTKSFAASVDLHAFRPSFQERRLQFQKAFLLVLESDPKGFSKLSWV